MYPLLSERSKKRKIQFIVPPPNQASLTFAMHSKGKTKKFMTWISKSVNNLRDKWILFILRITK